MHIAFGSVLVAALVFAPAGRSQGTADGDAIARLVAQLGSGKYAQREAAMRKLEALGEQALPALARATTSADLETRRRIEVLIPKIQLRAEARRLLAGKRVRLACKDVAVLDAIRELATKTGLPLLVDDKDMALARRKLTLDTGETTAWEALDRLCRAASLAEKPYTYTPAMIQPDDPVADARQGPQAPWGDGMEQLARGSALVLVERRAHPLPMHFAGAVRLRALPTTTKTRVAPEAALPGTTEERKETGFLLEVLPEPQVPWRGIVGVRITRAVDESGQVLSPSTPYAPAPPGQLPAPDVPAVWDGATGRPLADASLTRVVAVRLASGKQPSTRLKEIQGIVTAELTVVRELLAVTDVVHTAGRTVDGEDGRFLKVLQVTRTGDKLELRVLIQPQSQGAAGTLPFQVMRNHRGVLVMRRTRQETHATLSLQDARGVLLAPRSSERTLTPSMKGPGLLIEFRQVYALPAGQKGPLRLSCNGARAVAVDIPFTLREVPISPQALPARLGSPLKSEP